MVQLFGQSKESFCLAIDIGTASISAALFSYQKGEKPDILRIFRKYHKHSLYHQKDAFQKSALRDLMLIFKDIESYYPHKVIKEIRIGLAAPFYIARMLVISTKHDQKEEITENDINRITQKGAKEIEHDFLEDDVAVFETYPMKLTLNGYESTSAVGKQAQDITLTMRYAAVKKEFLKTLSERLTAATKAARIQFFTFPMIYFSIFYDIISQKREPLFIVDIGGETTEVTLIYNATVEQVFTLPIGVVGFIYRIAERFDTDNDSATALLKRYVAGTLGEEIMGTIKTILKSEIQKWQPTFAKLLQETKNGLPLAFTIFVLGGGAWINDLKEMLALTPVTEGQENKPEVLNTTPAAFRERLGHYGALAGPEDFGLLALILAPPHHSVAGLAPQYGL